MKRAVCLSLGVISVSFAACGGRPARSPEPDVVSSGAWTYDAVSDDVANEILVQARFPAGTLPELGVLRGAEPYVRDVEVAVGRSWRGVPMQGNAWRVPACRTEGCTIRYRFLFRDAARAFDDIERARSFDGVTIARPSMWLLHPSLARLGTRMRLHAATPPGIAFATGIYPSDDGTPDTYETDAAMLPAAPYTAFGAIEVHRASFRGASIQVASEPGKLPVSNGAIERWITASAEAVGDYFGCFPVPRVTLFLVPTDGDDVMRGHALGDGGAVIVVEIGRRTADFQLASDWVLPHELVHMGFPSVDPKHHWLEEGVATYVQPIARARAGMITTEAAWQELARGLSRGVPKAGDRGLDDTTAWGRTYWGGALFCFLADLEIRARTGNRYTFDDALRGIVAAGGTIASEWDFQRVLDAGDRAVGVPVLRELYDRMGRSAAKVDLDPTWKRLGVVEEEPAVRFDDGAPLAFVRRAITAEVKTDSGLATCPQATQSAQRVVHNMR